MKWCSMLPAWDVASGDGYYQNLCIIISAFWRAFFLREPLDLVPVIADTLPMYFYFPYSCSLYGHQQLSFSEVLLSAFSLLERFYLRSDSTLLSKQCLGLFDFEIQL